MLTHNSREKSTAVKYLKLSTINAVGKFSNLEFIKGNLAGGNSGSIEELESSNLAFMNERPLINLIILRCLSYIAAKAQTSKNGSPTNRTVYANFIIPASAIYQNVKDDNFLKHSILKDLTDVVRVTDRPVEPRSDIATNI